MADFSFLSDTDASMVDELISQTRDLCVLKQVSAINCSGFVDTLLSNDLESCFNRLKSFLAENSKLNLPPVGKLWLSQEAYVEKALERFNLSKAYSSVVGSLMYAMIHTRPNIAHAVRVVS